MSRINQAICNQVEKKLEQLEKLIDQKKIELENLETRYERFSAIRNKYEEQIKLEQEMMDTIDSLEEEAEALGLVVKKPKTKKKSKKEKSEMDIQTTEEPEKLEDSISKLVEKEIDELPEKDDSDNEKKNDAKMIPLWGEEDGFKW